MFAGGVNGGLVFGVAAPERRRTAVCRVVGLLSIVHRDQRPGPGRRRAGHRQDRWHAPLRAANAPSSSSCRRHRAQSSRPIRRTSNAVLSTVSLSGQVIGIEIAQDRLMVIDQRYTNTTYIGLLLYNTSSLSSPELDAERDRRGDLRRRPHGAGLPLRGRPAALLQLQRPGERDGCDALRDRERPEGGAPAVLHLLHAEQLADRRLHDDRQRQHGLRR